MVKFTEQGEIFVRVVRVGERHSDVLLRFEVADTGVGIAPEEQWTVFEKFLQVSQEESFSAHGTGLRLTSPGNSSG